MPVCITAVNHDHTAAVNPTHRSPQVADEPEAEEDGIVAPDEGGAGEDGDSGVGVGSSVEDIAADARIDVTFESEGTLGIAWCKYAQGGTPRFAPLHTVCHARVTDGRGP